MHKSAFAIFLLVVVLETESCNKPSTRIALPVCACIVRGAAWTKDPNPPVGTPIVPGEGGYWIHAGNQVLTNQVNGLVYAANDNVWIPGADIAMIPQIDKRDGYIKVIDDPDVSVGKYGDIEGTEAGGELVAGKCREAWGSSLIPDGLVLIVCRNVINNDGTPTNEAGFAEPYDAVLARNGGKDLCSFPRNKLTTNDVKGRYMIIQDPTLLGLKGESGNGIPYVVLAHEFGHVLMLGHGDGLDNDHNGTLPPKRGPRLFDSYCDPKEFAQYDLNRNPSSPESLMGVYAGYDTTVTDLQKEVARAVAQLLPGAAGPYP